MGAPSSLISSPHSHMRTASVSPPRRMAIAYLAGAVLQRQIMLITTSDDGPGRYVWVL
jgi:hypothetical protein